MDECPLCTPDNELNIGKCRRIWSENASGLIAGIYFVISIKKSTPTLFLLSSLFMSSDSDLLAEVNRQYGSGT